MQLNRLVLYVKDVEATAEFYQTHFGYRRVQYRGDRIVELLPDGSGVVIMLHPAAKGQKTGQSSIKLVFDVEDVENFHAVSAEKGLAFGTIHKADGYVFANCKDPAGNSISISSRAFVIRP